jgi:hypothetical protein
MSNTANTIVGFLIILVGLPLFILSLRDYIKSARAMQYSKAQTFGRVSAYVLGILFVMIGILNFWNDFEQRQVLHTPIASFVFDLVFIFFGFFTWATMRFQYGGSFWSIVGAFLVGGAFAGTISIFETHIRGGQYSSPSAFYARIVSCWVVGGILLFIGHRRHTKKKQVLSKIASEFAP